MDGNEAHFVRPRNSSLDTSQNASIHRTRATSLCCADRIAEHAKLESVWHHFLQKIIKSGFQRKNAPPRETKNQKAERLKREAENPELKEKWDWGYKITNEKLRKICGAAPIGTLAEKFRLKYIAHVTRMSNSALQKQMIYCEAPRPQRGGLMNFWTKMKKATGTETEQLQKLCTTGTRSETDMDSLRGQPNPESRVRAEHIDRSTLLPE